QNANWITTAWPPEVHKILRYQWEDIAIPYWQNLADHAREHEIERICVEQHAGQLVYNVTLGYGHSEIWWRDFVIQLKQNDYDDVLSIEPEDQSLPPIVGARKSVELLRNVM
ncbi:MAG TPA: hypothetical protein VK900_07160, partial [Anaerolineales bacterium]|nr:hypothetical protein [Anaerolineales bacterium]